MRALPLAFQSALDSGATRLARCWKVVRTDGAALGFTDHDRALSFDGLAYEPDAGFTPSAIATGTGLSADTHEVAGALSSDRITEVDIAKGLYDRAEVTLFLVDWSDTSVRIVQSRGLIGEIRHGTHAFEAEITGLSDMLSQPVGRAYQHSCPCRPGDGSCGIDPEDPQFKSAAAIDSVDGGARFTVSGLGAYEPGWFAGGLLRWTSGANAGLEGQVKLHVDAGSGSIIELWLSPVFGMVPGDAFEIFAGCGKTAEAHLERFGNLVNFRGFPHMPGDDVVAGYPNSGGAHDGGSLFRS